MPVMLQKVEGFNRKTMPTDDETIGDDINIDYLTPLVEEMNVYRREADERPFQRGNWIIDMKLFPGEMITLKLPKEMKEESVIRFIKPLVDSLEKYKKDKSKND